MVSTIFIGHLLKVLSKLESKSRAIAHRLRYVLKEIGGPPHGLVGYRPVETIIFKCSRPKTFQVDIQVFQNEMIKEALCKAADNP